MKNKIIASLITAALIVSFAASCAETGANEPADATTAGGGQAETTPAVTESNRPNLPEQNYKGYEFRIMGRNEEHQKWKSVDIAADEANGEPINDAVYERNGKIEEKYNVKIKNVSVYKPADTIKPLIMAGEEKADLITDGLTALAGLMTAGYLVDLNEIKYLDFTNPWWDGNLYTDLSILGKSFLMTGDISVMDNIGTWALGFNKSMVKEFDLKDPYKMVNDGTWTYDRMYEMMKPVPADLDGNGTMDDFDRWAFVGENYNTYVLMAGSGATITQKDEDGLPYLTLNSEKNIRAFNKAMDLMTDLSMTLTSTKVKGKYTSIFDECINKNFGEDRALFWMGGMVVVQILRAYDVDFGLIPTPKLSEDQENYYSSYSTSNFTTFAVPITNTDLDRTGLITEALAAESVDTLTKAYYEITLKGKSLRDTESEATLDLVFSSRLYDLGAVFNWGGLFSELQTLTNTSSREFASRYAALEPAANTAIKNFVDSLQIEK